VLQEILFICVLYLFITYPNLLETKRLGCCCIILVYHFCLTVSLFPVYVQ
jgi:hypothetical protein